MGPVFNPLLLLLGVILGSFVFTLLGITLAVRVRTLNEYIIISPLYMLVFMLPLPVYFDLFYVPLLFLHPGQAALLLIAAAFKTAPAGELASAVILLLLWIGIAYGWARRWFYRFVILNGGGGGK